MKKITELLETIFSTANQRIKSPFFGSFIFSWIIINWKPIFYFLLSDDKINTKINIIQDKYEFFQNSLLYPLLLSFIYVVVFPYINQFIHWLTLRAEESKRNEYYKLRRTQNSYLQELAEQEKTLEDIRSGNRDIAQLSEKIELLNKDNDRLKVTIQNKDEAISDYGEQLNKITTENQQYKIELSKITEELTSSNFEFRNKLEYRSFKKEKIFDAFSYIIDAIKTEENLSNFENELIKEYLDFGIIEKNTIGNYQLTEKGKYFASYLKEI
ncbi:hypothetical protein FDT66_03980 [Polaribacter aestuariivivens]|uniref:Uncharacterized protein n=1 Tax=Polaribacter aestuariivivens TaxID=2304626 RepID=A0A5S3N729_9FLAO|nr:hypothetical protein [Polaribacter aestuariivivens]TMM31135.1 hypothetical protein FDT66_03980 [Polaribacter aestuariivivens]